MAGSVPAYTIGGITRPALFFDNAGNIILSPEAAAFAAAYGTKALYFGLPANTPYPPVAPTLSVPTDANAGANTVLENAAAGTQVGLTVLATNIGGPAVQYSLTNDAGGRFQINATSGVVTVAPGAVLNFEASTGHTIVVKATDGILTTSQTFTIAVSDVNDIAPKFDLIATTASTPENVATTTVVYNAHATDTDSTAANNTVTYALASGGDNDLFNIDADGHVTFKVSPNFDAPQDQGSDNVYNITVTASDGLPAHDVTRNVTITATDLNEAPVITSNGGGSSASFNLSEGVTAVTTVTATDPDVPAQTLTYSLVTGAGSPDTAKFNIDGSGNLTFVTPPNFEAPGSAANSNTYTVQVQVTDGGNPLLNDIQTITVNVQDVNESTPVITSSAAMTVNENAAAAAAVGSVVATDADGSAPNNAITYTATGGTGVALFDVNPTTGAVTVRSGAVLDREAATNYTLDVRAEDGATPALFTTQTLTISLNDLNDNTPNITSAVAMAVDENSASGAHVGTVVATDADATAPNNALTYTSTGGTGLTLFDVNPSTGEVTVRSGAVLDRELATSYTLDIKVTDGGTSGLVTTQTIAINLNDLNDHTPSITSAAAMSINEASPGGAAVGTVVAIDADATSPNNAVTYTATGGTGLALFDVNPTTGAVTVHSGAVLDFETTPSYALDVRATDGAGLFTTQTLTISLGNLAPTFATPPDSNASTNQTFGGAPPGSSIRLDAAAFDPAGGTVTFTLLDDVGGRFAIDSGTGVVTVGATPIVFDDPAHPTNTYTVTVRASDASGAHTDQTFDIAVLPETPPEVTAGNTLNYAENQAATAIDAALTVTDANNATLTGATVQITSNYVTGEDLLAFANTAGITGTFNAGNGTLTLSGVDTVANYQAALRAVTYINTSDNPSTVPRTVTFTANDGVVTSGATGTITVTPVNDAPSIGASHSLVYSENQAATAIDTALTLTDVDSAVITGATVQITGNYAAGEDFLGFVDTPTITGIFNAGTLTLTGNDTAANYQAALRAVTYFNNSDAPSSLSRTITFTATDDAAATSTLVTDTIIVTPTNDAPEVVAGHALNYDENDAPTVIDAAVTVADVDSANLTSATVQITGNYVDGEDVLSFVNQNGITASFNATTGILSLSGLSSVANYEAALQSVTYSNSSGNPSALDRTVTFIASDGAASSTAVTSLIHVNPANSAPDLTPDAPGPAAYTENAAATALLSGGAVVDADAPLNFALGSFTAAITANDAAGDQVVLLGSAPFAVSGTSLLYNGDLVGTVTGLGTISVSVTNLTAIATPTVVDLLAKSFGFLNSTNAPAAGSRTVTFTFHDGGNGVGADLFNSVTQTVNVTAVNDAPVNTAPNGTQLATQNTDLVFSAANGNAISISDVDILGGSETVTLTVTGGTLTLASTANLTVAGDNSASVELTGTVADINAALNGLIYHATTAGNSTLTIVTSDNGNTPTPAESDSDTVSILVVTPAVGVTLDLDDSGAGTGFSTIFNEDGAAVPIADTDAIIGTASLTIASATIVLTNGQPGDVLLVGSLPLSIASSNYDTATGVLTLTGTSATVVEFQTALSQITFSNSTQNPGTSNRTISVVVNDGTSNSNIAIATIQVTDNNDAPAVDLDGGGGPVDYATNYVATGSFIAIAAGNATVTDADNATLALATVVLTNAQADDVLAISGALPGGITANIDTAVANQITVTLSGPASAADFQAALKQVMFANSDTTPDPTPRVVNVTVSDGTDSSVVATTTINIAANSAPVANADTVSATEAGGVNNTVAGSNPSGNVITGTGSAGAVADADAQDAAATLTVVAVHTGGGTPGTVGVSLQGTHGSLTLNANGAYSYAVNNTNATVQALTSASLPISDVFNYTIQDSGGLQSTAVLTIDIQGADDLVQAAADIRTITEDAAPTTFTVLANDTLDPDAGALNTITTGTVTASGPGGTTIDTADVTVELVGGTEIKVTLGPDFQQLTGNETATITIPYTLTGNTGETSTANLVITVNGVNDLPVAVSDLTGNTMTEDAAATTFAVLGNDTLDKDHGAANTITTGTVTASGPVGAGIDAGDVTVNVIGGTQIRVTLQSDFQRLQEGQTATIDVPYTLLGDGADASSATFRVTVNGANDAPVVTAGAGATFTENGAAVSIAGSLTLTDIDNTTMSGAVVTLTNAQAGDVLSVQGQGASGDLASGVHFVVDNIAHTVTFSNVETAADYQAALRLVQFSSASENPATAARSFTITADDGQTLNHSGSAAASLTVIANDDAPVNTIPADNAVPTAFSNTNTAISGISVADVDSGSGIITTQLSVAHGTVAVTLAGGATISAGASGSATLTLSGSAAAINATLANNVTYRSADGYVGPDDLSVVTNDQGLTGNGGPLADADTVHIGVVAQVWYIDNTNAGPGNGAGTVADPFHSIAAFNASAGPGVNDYIVIRAGTGTYTGQGLNLQDGQQVYGAGEVLNLTNPVNGEVVNILNGSGARPTINVTQANDQGIDLASGNTIKGVNITTGAGTTGLDDGNNAVGTLVVDHMAISGAGQAVDIDQGGALTVSLESVSSSGGAQGIQLGGALTGSFAVTSGTLSGHTGSEFDVTGGAGTISYGGTIGNGSGLSASIGNRTGGTVTLSGSITDSNDAGGGIALTNNTGATINFTGGMTLNTGASAAFSATGGGTVNVTGTNHLTANGGTALNISNTTIGASNVTFHDISANGGTNGIVLNNTGTSGHLAVTGNGSVAQGGDSSGGTIQNTTGVGISLTSTLSPTLNNMNIQSTGGSGISGTDVTNFTFTNGTVNNSGTAHGVDASNIAFNSSPAGATNNIDGTITITNNVLSNAFYHGVDIQNRAGTIDNATISNNAITSATVQANAQGSGIHIVTFGTATSAANLTKATIDGNIIVNFPMGAGIAVLGGNSNAAGPGGTMGVPNNASNVIAITNNNIHGQSTASPIGSEGIVAAVQGGNAGSRSQGNFNISGNSITNTLGQGIVLSDFGNATVNAKVNNNTVDTNNIGKLIGSNGIGIGTGVVGTSTSATPLMTVEVIGNTVTDYDGNGIRLVALDTNGTLNATVQNNSVGRAAGGGFPSRIRVDSGNENNPGNNTINLDITGNIGIGTSVAGEAPGIGIRLGDGGAATNILRIEGLTPSPATDLQAESYIAGKNPAMFAGTLGGVYSPAKKAEVIHGTTFTATAGNVPQPLLAAAGGVQASVPTPGDTNLSQAELNSVVAAAIAQWKDAGATQAQLATLAAITFTVADLGGNAVGEHSAGHIVIDKDAAGHGWFVDSTPSDNSEFAYAENAARTDLSADPTSAAAGHLDLLTAVAHEMGHELELEDSAAAADAHNLMYGNLVDGERRLPGTADVPQPTAGPLQAQANAQAPLLPVIRGTAGNDTLDAGLGGRILVGEAGADHFVFANVPTSTPSTHVADYSFIQGDSFDFSALTSAFHGSGMSNGQIVRAVEDASGSFATLQVNTANLSWGTKPGPTWTDVAQIDGAHAGDDVSVLIDNGTIHRAQIHVDLLV